WNFIGNAKGENVDKDNLEVTRLIRKYEPKYLSVLPSTPLSGAERREFVAFQKMVTDYTSIMDEANFGKLNYTGLKPELDSIVSSIGKTPEEITKADLDQVKPNSNRQKMALRIAKKEIDSQAFDKFYQDIEEAVSYFTDQTDFHLNKKFDPRSIVGDDYED